MDESDASLLELFLSLLELCEHDRMRYSLAADDRRAIRLSSPFPKRNRYDRVFSQQRPEILGQVFFQQDQLWHFTDESRRCAR